MIIISAVLYKVVGISDKKTNIILYDIIFPFSYLYSSSDSLNELLLQSCIIIYFFKACFE